MPGSCYYSIDTSALINWWVEDYSPDVFPGLLPLMKQLILGGRLCAVRSVKDELGDGDLREWCLAQPGFFVDEDEAIQNRVARFMATYQNPKKTRGIDKADPFVIALAATRKGDWQVVSAERGGTLVKNPKVGNPLTPISPRCAQISGSLIFGSLKCSVLKAGSSELM